MLASMQGNAGASISNYNLNYPSLNGNGERPSKFDWHLKLDRTERYQLDWRVEYADNQIVFALRINQTLSNFRRGFDIFALGFSQNGKLSSSDYCLVWYDLAHRIHLQDALTDSSERLKLVDESLSRCELVRFPSRTGKKQNFANAFESYPKDGPDDSASEDSNDQIEVIFKRPLDICLPDKNSPYYTIDNGTTHLVWFAIRGPLLSIDGLDLRTLKLSNGDGQHEHQTVIPKAALADFEFGMKRVQLITSKQGATDKRVPPKPEVARRGSIHEVRMDNFEIPAKETTYWCKLFKLPHKFEYRRFHITRYEAVIANEPVVHHMELFNCANLSPEQERKLKVLHESPSGWSGDCNANDRPVETMPCRRVVLAWAMGAHPLEYPEQVGQSIGGHNYSPYLVLEVHYNNVAATKGLLDSSGLRFHYTSRLRPFDAGVLEVGLEYTDKNSIPPNMVAPLAGHCVSECTRASMVAASAAGAGRVSRASVESRGRKLARPRRLANREDDGEDATNELDAERKTPNQEKITSSTDINRTLSETTNANQRILGGDGGIYIFAAQMHTHLTGVASWTEQVRGGKLLRELQRDDHYSPHFQEIRLLPEPVYVAPGDALIHYCLYDTRERFNITLGGYATTDEMCVTYLHYYPRIDLEVCKSSVDSAALEQYFAYLAKQEAQPTSKRLLERWPIAAPEVSKAAPNGMKSVRENYLSIEWSKRRSDELIQFYSNAPLSVQCNRSDGNRFPGFWNGLPATRVWVENDDNRKRAELPYSSFDQNSLMASEYRGMNARRRHAACKRPSASGAPPDEAM